MEFEAPETNVGSWMTALAIIVVLPILAIAPIAIGGPPGTIVALVVAALVPLLLVLSVGRLMKKPMRYRIEGGTLIVPAHLTPVRVPLAGARVTVGPVAGWRVAGTALSPFLLGTFADRAGLFHVAATAATGVWVTGTRRVFVTPTDIPGFVAALVAAGAIPG